MWCFFYIEMDTPKDASSIVQCRCFFIKTIFLLFAAGFLWKQAIGEGKERSKEAVSREDLSEENTVRAHFASARLIHRLRRTSHPGKMSDWLMLRYIRYHYALTARAVKEQNYQYRFKQCFRSECRSQLLTTLSFLSKCGYMMRMLDWTAAMWRLFPDFTRFLMRSLVSDCLVLEGDMWCQLTLIAWHVLFPFSKCSWQ